MPRFMAGRMAQLKQRSAMREHVRDGSRSVLRLGIDGANGIGKQDHFESVSACVDLENY